MLKFTPLSPTCIGFLSTFRCVASCEDCCFACNPRQGRAMTLDEMKFYVDECLQAWPDTIKHLDISGGECMTMPEVVKGIAEYATQRGLIVTILSNAFWAPTLEKAARTLRSLADKGVKQVVFSTGGSHTKYVPFQNVRNAAIAAAELGLMTHVRVELHFGQSGLLPAMAQDPEWVRLHSSGKIDVTYSDWMKFTKKGRTYKLDTLQGKEDENCDYLFTTVSIDPYGEVYCCCGLPSARIPHMRLGNIHKEPIRVIYERAFDDVLKVWLRLSGPRGILQYVQDKTHWQFDWHTGHRCDLCRLIWKDPRILPFLREHYYDYIDDVSLYNAVYGKK